MKNLEKRVGITTTIVVIVTLVLCFINMLYLSGCATTAPAGNSGSEIQVVLMALDSPYWRSMKDGCEAAGKDLGISVEVKAPAKETDVLEQVNLIETALSEKPKAIVVAPCDAKMVQEPLNKALKDGLRVVLTDSDVDEEDQGCRDVFVGVSNYDAAFEAGVKASKWLSSGDTILVLNKNPNATDHRDRENGFINGVKSVLPDVNSVTKIPEEDARNSAINIVSDYLSANPVNMVYCTSFDSADGAIVAINGDKNIKVVTFDTDTNTEKLMNDGLLHLCIDQDPYNLGYQAIKATVADKLPDSGIIYSDCKYLIGE